MQYWIQRGELLIIFDHRSFVAFMKFIAIANYIFSAEPL